MKTVFFMMIMGVVLSCAPKGAGSGGMAFELRFLERGTFLPLGIIPSGVESLTVTLYEEDESVVVGEDGGEEIHSFLSSDDYLLITDIPSGQNRRVVLDALTSTDEITHRGERTGVSIEDGETTNLGTMTLTALSEAESTATILSSSYSGQGTSEDPYLISSASELANVGTAFCGSEESNGCGASFRLTTDLDVSSVTVAMIGSYASGSSAQAFTGTFDGGGFAVTGLTLATTANTTGVGLFSYIGAEGSVQNLSVSAANVVGNEKVGILVGVLAGNVNQCSSSGTVAAGESVGGLVGVIERAGVIADSSSSAVAEALTTDVGGLVGTMVGGAITTSSATGSISGTALKSGGLVGEVEPVVAATIAQSFATGAVSGASYVGGLVGHANGPLTISDSYATGTVTVSSTNEMTGGGLVGKIAGDRIERSYATGAVEASGVSVTESLSGLGGLVGYVKDDGVIIDAYAWGAVTSIDDAPSGGLVGHLVSGSIERTYATGSVTGASKKGGLIGFYEAGTLTANYWDTVASGQSHAYDGANGSAAGIIIKSTAEMDEEATFTVDGWDFTSTWQIGSSGYPEFR